MNYVPVFDENPSEVFLLVDLFLQELDLVRLLCDCGLELRNIRFELGDEFLLAFFNSVGDFLRDQRLALREVPFLLNPVEGAHQLLNFLLLLTDDYFKSLNG